MEHVAREQTQIFLTASHTILLLIIVPNVTQDILFTKAHKQLVTRAFLNAKHIACLEAL